MTVRTRKPADLILSGGGVKGIGLVGGAVALMDAGYHFQRVSGTSAGSIVGALFASASLDENMTGEQIKEIALGLDYRKFLDPTRCLTAGVVKSASRRSCDPGRGRR